MSYQSIAFVGFCAAVMLVYYTVGRKHQSVILAAANLVFYLLAGPQYLPFLLVTMIGTFLSARKMGKIYADSDARLAGVTDRAEKKEIRSGAQKAAGKWMRIGLWITLALLIFCKYLTFIETNLNHLLGALHVPEIPLFDLILPVGISFYSFMALGYVLDVYWKRYKAEENFLEYAVFLGYFPHIVQGPIDRYNEFQAQRKEPIAFRYDAFVRGAELMIWGFFKKLVIADRLGLYVDTVVGDFASYQRPILILTMIFYSIQIYADFSGCIDIVTGASELFGIELRKNFDHPYFAKTMAEFWRRWHMSLMEWFKDYIFFPVAASQFVKKRKKALKNGGHPRRAQIFTSCFPIFVVWVVTGVWHGAAWHFIAWGMFHCLVLVISQIFEGTFQKWNTSLGIRTEAFSWKLFQMLRSFAICCVGRVFFVLPSLREGLEYFKCTFRKIDYEALFHKGYVFGMTYPSFLALLVSMAVLLVADILAEKRDLREVLAKQNFVFRWIILLAGLFAILLWGVYGPGYDAASFIYEKF